MVPILYMKSTFLLISDLFGSIDAACFLFLVSGTPPSPLAGEYSEAIRVCGCVGVGCSCYCKCLVCAPKPRVPLDLGSSLSLAKGPENGLASGPGAGLDYTPPAPHARSSLPLSRLWAQLYVQSWGHVFVQAT